MRYCYKEHCAGPPTVAFTSMGGRSPRALHQPTRCPLPPDSVDLSTGIELYKPTSLNSSKQQGDIELKVHVVSVSKVFRVDCKCFISMLQK
jgi:hypothetical protein